MFTIAHLRIAEMTSQLLKGNRQLVIENEVVETALSRASI